MCQHFRQEILLHTDLYTNFHPDDKNNFVQKLKHIQKVQYELNVLVSTLISPGKDKM